MVIRVKPICGHEYIGLLNNTKSKRKTVDPKKKHMFSLLHVVKTFCRPAFRTIVDGIEGSVSRDYNSEQPHQRQHCCSFDTDVAQERVQYY